MNVYELIEMLADAQIIISLENDSISVEAPKGTVTPSVMALLKEHKHELINHLRRFEKEKLQIEPADRSKELALSFAQQRLWMLDQIDNGSPHYSIPGALKLVGRLNRPALDKAFSVIIERHESLRTSFSVNANGQPIQIINDAVPFVAIWTDLSHLDESERQLQLTGLAEKESWRAFDLSRDLMLRAQLIKLAEDEHIVLVTMHHIASDGWSMSILINEFGTLYKAFCQEQENPLEPLGIQYADYAVWQRNWLQGEVLDQQVDYWEKQLAGLPVVHNLPLDHPRPATQSFAGDTYGSQIDVTLSEALSQLCLAEGATLFMGLHAAFSVLLARYSNETDVVLGTPVANRGQAEVAGLIGFFVNTLVLRSDLSELPSFTELLRQSKEMLLGAYAHQQVPFEQLVERLQPERSLSHSPLFQVMLVLQNNEQGTLELPGLTISPIGQSGAGIAKYDLTISVTESAQGLQILWEYNTDLFEASTIGRMTSHFELLLRALVTRPEECVFNVNMLSAAERHRLLKEWNDTATEYPNEKCIHELFEVQVEANPNAVAAVFEDQQLTYAELNEKANQLAHYLVDERLVKPDTLVGLCVERSLDNVIGTLAILKAGGAYVPLDPEYPQSRLEYMLNDAKLETVLIKRQVRDVIPIDDAQAVFLDDEELQQLLSLNSRRNPDTQNLGLTSSHLAYVIYTSGSTGTPKGVMVSHKGLCNLSCAQISGFGLDHKTVDQFRVLQFASVAFDAAASELWTTLNSGSRLILCPAEAVQSPIILGNLVERFQVTHATLPPALLPTLEIGQWQSVKTLIVAGDSCPRELANVWSEGRRFVNAYGPTESTVCASMGEYSRRQPTLHIGKPIQNCLLLVVNTLGELAPPGVAGELYIGGAGLARGYLNQPELTKEKFIHVAFDGETEERWYRTGDLVRYLSDGSLEFLGRIDRQIKVRGFRIELGEIENTLGAHVHVKDVIVLAKSGTGNGEKRLVAYAVTDAIDRHDQNDLPVTSGNELIEQLRDHLNQCLPRYMVPAAFVLLEQWPLTPNGKVDRNALPEPEAASQQAAYVPPQTETEKIVCEIWQDILGVERIGITDNFFQLGGHSLLIVKVISRLQQHGFSMTVRQLFTAPFVVDLAKALDTNRSDDPTIFTAPANLIPESCEYITPEMLPLVDLSEGEIAHIVSKIPGGAANVQDIYPLGPLQEGILFHHMMSTQGDVYVLPSLFKFNSRRTVTEFIENLQFVINRHDVLRTAVFWQELSVPVQIVCRHVTVPVTWLELDSSQTVEAHLRARCAPDQQWMDLGQAPLLRLQIAFDSESEQYFVLLQTHHVILDHVGLEVIQRELALYQAGKGDSLPVPVPYREFIAHAQHQALHNNAEDFFTRTFGDLDETTAPFGLRDINGDGSRIVEARGEVPDLISGRIRSVAKDLMISPSALFHTAAAMVVAGCSGRDDVTFGTVLSGRLQGTVGAEHMLGVFINTLPVRVRLKNVKVLNAVHQVQNSLLSLLPYEQASLAVAQRCSSLPAGSPLFTAMFNYRHSAAVDDKEVNTVDAGNDTGIEFLAGQERTNYPFNLTVDDFGNGFSLDVQVDASIDAERIVAYFQKAVDGLVDALEKTPEYPIDTLSILPEVERQQVLGEWNSTQVKYPTDLCIHQLFQSNAEANPNAIAVVFDNQQLTYQQLNEKANQLAHYLINERQVKPDCLVGICVERSLDMVVGILAILKSGSTYVPLDPEYPDARLTYMLQDARLTTVLTQTHLRETTPVSNEQALCLDSDGFKEKLQTYPLSNPDTKEQGLTPSNLAYVIYTSGSTGDPKGVMIEHRSVANLAINIQNMDLSPKGGRWGWNASYAFDASVQGLSQLMLGTTLTILSEEHRRDPSRLLEILGKLDVIDCTPIMVEAWFLAGIERHLPNLIIGGEPISPKLWLRLVDWQHRYGKKAINVYGPTECTVDSSACVITGNLPHIGKGLANYSLCVLNDAQLLVPLGVVGELHIGGVGVARGYLNHPDLTTGKFITNPFYDRTSQSSCEQLYKTGDLVRWLPDGNLEFLGRVDHQVKIRGFRVERGEIEHILNAQADVKDAVVLAKDFTGSSGDEKRLVAYVVTDVVAPVGEDDRESTIANRHEFSGKLRHHLSRTLPDYMVPSAFVFLEQLPLTPSGKVDRKALPEPDIAKQQANYVAPRTDTEIILCEIWQEILGVDRVGITDNFFQLGGHSLLIIQVISRLQQRGFSISARQVFTTPLVGDLAKALEAERSHALPVFKAPPNRITEGCEFITPEMLPLITLSTEEIAHIVDNVPGGAVNVQDIYPLGPLQEGILYHHMMSTQGDVYVLPSLFKLRNREAVMEFIDSLQFIISRHDVLRTAIFWQELSVPVQVVCRHATLPVTWLEFDTSQPIEEYMRARCAPEQQWIELKQAPLIQLQIAVDPESEQHFVLLQSHHIISDHVGLEIIEKEIALYLTGRSDLLPSPIPYREFVAHTQYQTSQHDAESFFTNILSDIEEPTAPFNILDNNGDGSQIMDARAMVPANIAGEVRRLARELTISPATVFHTAWAMVVGACSARSDVVFGTVLSGRLQGTVGAEQMLGVFINTLPIRVKLEDSSVIDIVNQVHNSLLDLLPYEQASLSLAQRCSGVKRGLPLFTALLNYRHTERVENGGPERTEDYSGIEHLGAQERANYPFGLSVDDFGDDFVLSVQVNNAINADSIIGYMQTAIAGLVEAMGSAPRQSIDRLSVLPRSELHQLLVEWASVRQSYPKDKCVHELFERQVDANPHSVAVVFQNQRISYQQLNEKANQVAHYLVKERQIKPDALVGICFERSLDMVVCMLAVLKAGGAYVPLDPEYPETRLSYMIEDAKLTTVLTQCSLSTAMPEIGERALYIDSDFIKQELLKQAVTNLGIKEIGLASRHLAYVIYTSGTTGDPKGVMIEHRSLVNLVVSDQKLFDIQSDSKLLNPLSLGFDAGNGYLWSSLCAGAALYLESPVNDLFDTIEKESITHAVMAAAMLKAQKLRVTTSLRVLISGGDVFDTKVLSGLSETTKVFNVYGPTENTVTSTCQEISANQYHTIGKPIANVVCLVLSQNNQCVPVGCAGELCIGGDGLARGYLNRPDLTEEKFVSNPFYDDSDSSSSRLLYKTGDLARWLPDGNLEFLGRIDHQVKVRGFRVELSEIETTLRTHPNVKDALVVVREVASSDKQLAAYVSTDAFASHAMVPETDRRSFVEGLRHFLVERLPSYMVPSSFVLMVEFPLTLNGKVDRKALPEPETLALQETYVAPRTKTEEKVCELWQGMLNVKRVGITDDFFQLGGDSLVAVRFVGAARKYGLEFTVANVVRHPTIEQLTAVSDQSSSGSPKGQDVVVGEVPLSAAQRNFLKTTFDQPNWGNAVKYFDFHSLDKDIFENSLSIIIGHHDALRAKFTKTESGWKQVIVGVEELGPYIEYLDVSDVEERDKVATIDRYLISCNGDMDLEQPPLIEVKVFFLGEDRGYVGRINIHHLLVDQYSLEIILDDWAGCFSALSAGNKYVFPQKSASTFAWISRLIEYVNSPRISAEVDYWLGLPWNERRLLPVDYPANIDFNTAGSNRDIAISLTKEQTRDVLESSRLSGVPFVNVLIAALAKTLAEYSQGQWIPIRVLEAGRGFDLDLDVSRTVGWLCVHRTLMLRVVGDENPDLVVQSVNRQIEKMPNKGLGLELLQCYHRDKDLSERLESLCKTEMFLNYQGITEGGSTVDRQPFSAQLDKGKYKGQWISPLNVNNEKFTCNARVYDGRFCAEWRYSENLYDRSSMVKLTNKLLDNLVDFSRACVDDDREYTGVLESDSSLT